MLQSGDTGSRQYSEFAQSRAANSRFTGPLLILILIFPIAAASVLPPGSKPAMAQEAGEKQDDPAATNLHTIGISAYEKKDYPVAVEQWSRLLREYPDYSYRLDIKYLIGQAWFKQAKYEESAKTFRELRESIPVMSQFRNGPALLVFSGFSEYSLAKAAEDPKKASPYLDEAIARYEDFFQMFPDDDLIDQARYFHGLAVLRKNDIEPAAPLLEAATKSFAALIEKSPESPLVPKAIHELGRCHELAGRYDEALKLYTEFPVRFSSHELAPAVALLAAQTQLLLWQARQNAGDTGAAKTYFSDAIKGFDELSRLEGFPDQDQALFCKAECLQGISDIKAAAESLADLVTRFPQSRFAGESMLNAGKFFFAADDLERAAEWLERTSREFADGKDEAIHWLARIHLQKKEFDKALEIAGKATENGGGGKFRASLLLDTGDALHELAGRRKESISVYRSIAEQFPDDPAAARARYYAACACLMENDLAGATADASAFRDKYPDHELLPVTLEVLAEAALKTGKYAEAEATFKDLQSRFPEHEGVSRWKSRLAWALSLQNKGTDAIGLMEANLAKLTDPVERAESHYIIGSTWFGAKEFGKAADSFESALSENPKRTDANLIRLLIARSRHETGDFDKAIEAASAVLANQPSEPHVAEANYRLGEAAYEKDDLAGAVKYYTAAIDAPGAGAFAANALYGRAWAWQGQKEYKKAIDDFTRVITDHRQSDVAPQALRGRAVALRNNGQADEALTDINEYLTSSPAGDDLWQAKYERGLCHAFLEKWPEAIADLEPLVSEMQPASKVADNLLYELAWALRKNKDLEKSVATFRLLGDKYADSVFAAESRFHVGESYYDAGNFEEAARFYEMCLALNPDANIGERAAFKLAWSAFERDQWDVAHKLFVQQVEKYPEGPLKAVGLSMVAESLFHGKKFSEAVSAYKVAVPAINDAGVSDESVRILTPLHAAQSANKAGDFETARRFAEQLLKDYPDSGYQYAARFELGTALDGLGKPDEAITAWQPVAEKSIDKLGARARAMIGEAYFKKQDYKEAINQFKLVVYGYATIDQKEEIDPWRAFSAYEAARCYYVRIKDASPEERPQLIEDARYWFQYLIENYQTDKLVGDARKQLEALDKLK
jgi:cellulose synthase operon protein C